MANDTKYPAWFLWLWERGLTLFAIVGIVVMIVGVVLAYHFEIRLNEIEGKLTDEPPRRYEPPDLDQYAADDVPDDAVAVEQTVYVPAYSHVYYDGGRPHLLEAMLSIRNTDVARPIYVRSVKYYDTKGQLVKTYVDRLIRLGPLATIEFLVERGETKGGSGANFLVDWLATEDVSEPAIEAVMVGMFGTRAFSFARSGQPINAPAGASPDE